MTHWLAILALLWPLSVAAGGGADGPHAGNKVAIQSASLMAAVDCLRTVEPEHVHCHHATHGSLAANTLSPEHDDDFAWVAHSEIPLPLAAAALLAGPRFHPPLVPLPSFILFGNFRS